jgi:nucleotide-binding universal stress UspA family protein
MTERRENNPAVRILLALDASPHGQAAIDAAASLAADMRAELQGLFIEDINLLRLAGLPFTREVDEASAALRPLDVPAMEQALRIKAAEVRQAMATKADELRVRWSFQVTRGEFFRSTLAAATQADLLVLTREGRSPRSVRRAETAPIVVAYDGSSSAAGALQTAAKLVQRLGGPLVILIVAENVEQRKSISRSLTVWLQEQNLVGTVHDLAIKDAKALVQVARQWEGRAFVVNRDCRLLDETTIGSLVDELMYPVVLVG